MAKSLSNREKFLSENRSSSSGNSWQFNKKQLDQIESFYGINIRKLYETKDFSRLKK